MAIIGAPRLLGVACVVYNQLGQVLLQERDVEHGRGLWVLPGGKLDEDDPFKGTQRELKEELNIDVLYFALRSVFHAYDVKDDGKTPFIMLYYATLYIGPAPQNMEPSKCKALKWFYLDELPVSQMWDNDVSAIEAANRINHLSVLRTGNQ
jgi:8-oxo-dGTP pyrophosphatase MutT (NUDIX family)